MITVPPPPGRPDPCRGTAVPTTGSSRSWRRDEPVSPPTGVVFPPPVVPEPVRSPRPDVDAGAGADADAGAGAGAAGGAGAGDAGRATAVAPVSVPERSVRFCAEADAAVRHSASPNTRAMPRRARRNVMAITGSATRLPDQFTNPFLIIAPNRRLRASNLWGVSTSGSTGVPFS